MIESSLNTKELPSVRQREQMECDDEAVSWLVDKSAGSKRGNPPS